MIVHGFDNIESLAPGSHLVLLSNNPTDGLKGRTLGLELRDTLLVLAPIGASFAFLFRKTLEGTVVENVLKYGTGGLNVDACRVAHASAQDFEKHKAGVEALKAKGGSLGNSWKNSSDLSGASDVTTKGRWPSNLVLIHGSECRSNGRTAAWHCQDECLVAALDQQSGLLKSGILAPQHGGMDLERKHKGGFRQGTTGVQNQYGGDTGGASRFFPQFANEEGLLDWLQRLLGL